jgi:hypothetical protein
MGALASYVRGADLPVVGPSRILSFHAADSADAMLVMSVDAAERTASVRGSWVLEVEGPDESALAFRAEPSQYSCGDTGAVVMFTIPAQVAERALSARLLDDRGRIRWVDARGGANLLDGERTTAPRATSNSIDWDMREFDSALVTDRETGETLANLKHPTTLEHIAPDRPLTVALSRGLNATDPITAR